MNLKQHFLLKLLMQDNSMRDHLIKQFEKELSKSLLEPNTTSFTAVQVKKFQWSTNLLKTVLKNYDKGYISRDYIMKLANVFIDGAFHYNDPNSKITAENYHRKYGIYPPSFLVISPTKACNLCCYGCYANSHKKDVNHLDYDLLDKLVGEFYHECNGRFIVLSGGEPLCYNDGGKTIFDLFEKYSDVFFMFYTNGTLFTEKIIDRMAVTGNAVPCISVEGYEKETDSRRGKGTFAKILDTFRLLRKKGVPFSISVTATEANKDILLTDRFYEYFFDKEGASYMWQFQLMPIGRGKSIFDLMPSPETRIQLFRVWERQLNEKGHSIADFWNSGMLTNGCIAYGRKGGYVYIDWDGKIMPCVFVPYYIDTIGELYERGETLGDALNKQLFKNGRNWQKRYGLDEKRVEHNCLMPCSIRDHYSTFKNEILTVDSKGSDEVADFIKADQEYSSKLEKYDTRLKELSQEIWETEYADESNVSYYNCPHVTNRRKRAMRKIRTHSLSEESVQS